MDGKQSMGGENAPERLMAEVPVAEYIETCVDVDKFLGYCRRCSNYAQNWACPPFRENPMTVWKQYRVLRLYARVLWISGEENRERLMERFRREKDLLSREVLELEQQFPGARSLAAGTCTQCRRCARLENRPCRFPEQVRPSIEALGGDVGKTMEIYLHRPLQWIQEGKLPAYLTMVAGLLY